MTSLAEAAAAAATAGLANGIAVSSNSSAPLVPPKDASRYPSTRSSSGHTDLIPLPDIWYYFFGIFEPLTVLSGAVYAIIYQNNYHDELVPNAFHKASHGISHLVASSHLPAATSLALGQLGSCYILIMLNSALMIHAFKAHFSHEPKALEQVLRRFFIVLGVADWTHIGLTIYGLPSPEAGWEGTAAKLGLLLKPSSYNSLLAGNIIVTAILFTARCMWWFGIGRQATSSSAKDSKSL
ncbi:hypothetical protein IE81DRAFT_284926 [Ceraceosorus guamensis]|uniref:DUF7704 domain-containing protein n=1 Tax=Ceraceosorus guamensis TaxID=1522189 RepID=A0A316W7J6_9BASI|nr:hypothetical protein IE81DRAFT_284926 [Ceraceosorus guamensis]PWN45896.1 hypothetical protein IE81DRAFT_284926 [Ceraceosorus guamensis]